MYPYSQCVLIPLGSPTDGSKTAIYHCSQDTTSGVHTVHGVVYWDGYGTGGVWLGGYTGEYYPCTAQGGHIPAKRAPEGFIPGVGGDMAGCVSLVHGAPAAPVPPTPAHAGLPGPAPLYWDCSPGKGRDSATFPGNLVKTAKCHRN